MKHVIVFCCIALFFTSSTHSQWELRYPGEYDYPVSDFVFTGAGNGFFVTGNGVIEKTTDSGKSWRLSTFIKGDRFLAVSFADGNRGIAYSPYMYLNDTTTLLVTTDAGASWTQSTALHAGSLLLGRPGKAQLLYADDSTALATFEDGTILRSTDISGSWKVVRENRYYMPSDFGVPYGWISSFCRLTNGTILAVGNDINAYRYGAITDSLSYILKSTDTGKSWSTLWRGSKESMLMVSFADTLRGWMCGDTGIYKTTDGGNSWALKTRSVNGQNPLVGIAACDTSTVYAVDSRGDFYSSTTGGNGWAVSYGALPSPPAKMQFLSRDTGYCGGVAGLYRTTNAGSAWTKQTGNYAGKLDKLEFTDDRAGYAIVNNSVNKTTDGGYSWRVLPEGQNHVLGLSAVDSSDVWIAALDSVMHSTDGGATWTMRHFDGAYIHNVYFLDREFGMLFDVWGQPDSYAAESVIATTNGGSTWTRYPLPAPLYGVRKLSFISKEEGWFDSQEGLYHTTDGGQGWEAILRGDHGNPWNQAAFSFDFVNSNNGWFGYYDLMYSTSDGGKSWVQVRLPYSVEIKDMKFVDKSTGFSVGQNGRIFSTSDSGGTWTTETTSDPYDLFSVSVVRSGSSKRIRIGGDGFTILAKDIVTHIRTIDGGPPIDYYLLQNFPNPFNPSTTIRFGLPTSSNVEVTVYNMLGQQVSVLVQGRQEAGNHEVKFDGTALASGVYFYRIRAGSFLQTRALLLIR